MEFHSAQATHAVCSYCRSVLVQAGPVLRRLGRVAEVFEDYSPLQLGTAGRLGTQGFVLVGRMLLRGSNGAWTEWQALLDDGSMATLSEDNGSFVFSRPATLGREVPAPEHWRVGMTTAVQGRSYSVTVNDTARIAAAEGELPRLPPLDSPFPVVELRSAEGEVISLEWMGGAVTASRGSQVKLDALQLTGLRSEAAKGTSGRQFACPHCGAPVDVKLETTRSVTCTACNSLIDVSDGLGGELRHAIQDEPVRPLIPLGRVGTLQGVPWQVVGFQHRMGQVPGDDEQFGWSEYLLFHRSRGFSFLVDAEDGWSLVRPTTGAPRLGSTGQTATYNGKRYDLKTLYDAETFYVAGEFYWPVERGQRSSNRDFAAGPLLLSLERTTRELTWSAGNKLNAGDVAKAFGLDSKRREFARSDVGPTSSIGGLSLSTWLIILMVIILLVVIFSRDDEESGGGSSGSGWRSSGGSYGGWSSGGGHK